MKKAMIIICLVFSMMIGCKKESITNIEETESVVLLETSENDLIIEEEEDMERHICTVIEISDYLYIQSMKNEVFKLELSYNNDFKVGDSVYVNYSDKTPNDDETYSITVNVIRLSEPAKPVQGY